MLTSAARIPTTSGSRYLQQLCKHWSHKFPVEFTAEQGDIDLPLGRCRLTASGEVLAAELTGAADEAALAKFEEVVSSHLKRFAFREELAVAWVRA